MLSKKAKKFDLTFHLYFMFTYLWPPLENLNFMTVYKATTKILILAVNFSYESLQCDFNSILIPQPVEVVMT